MNALDAMTRVLDINETVDQLKERNTGDNPDLLLCKTTDLLLKSRSILIGLMKATELIGGGKEN